MGRHDKRNSGHENGPGRQVLVSKALSRLLRHQAQAEKIPITSEGWVRVDHLLSWKGLSLKSKFHPAVTLEEIFRVVNDNEKQRFAVLYTKDHPTQQALSEPQISNDNNGLADKNGVTHESKDFEGLLNSESSTKRATEVFDSGNDVDPSHYLIRANQGHSMKEVETEGLLTPITLDNPSSIPEVVVHGTFYGAWSNILKDGGLRRMNRNMVHFATGPPLHEVIPKLDQSTDETITEVLNVNKVISGMRNDAQILIYIDIKRCLEDVETRGIEMKWWRSQNGVILTEGCDEQVVEENGKGVDEHLVPPEEAKMKATWKDSKTLQKLVPIGYWQVAVETKAGLGTLWRQGEGVIRELPQHLRDKGMPRGKGRGFRGGGRGR